MHRHFYVEQNRAEQSMQRSFRKSLCVCVSVCLSLSLSVCVCTVPHKYEQILVNPGAGNKSLSVGMGFTFFMIPDHCSELLPH